MIKIKVRGDHSKNVVKAVELRGVYKNGKKVGGIGSFWVLKGIGHHSWFGRCERIERLTYRHESYGKIFYSWEYRIYGPSVVFPHMNLYETGFHFWRPEDWRNKLQFVK